MVAKDHFLGCAWVGRFRHKPCHSPRTCWQEELALVKLEPGEDEDPTDRTATTNTDVHATATRFRGLPKHPRQTAVVLRHVSRAPKGFRARIQLVFVAAASAANCA